MSQATLSQLSQEMMQLTEAEKLLLLERLVHQLRRDARKKEVSQALLAMSQDPEVQREIAAIETDFAGTLADGLNEEDHGTAAG